MGDPVAVTQLTLDVSKCLINPLPFNSENKSCEIRLLTDPESTKVETELHPKSTLTNGTPNWQLNPAHMFAVNFLVVLPLPLRRIALLAGFSLVAFRGTSRLDALTLPSFLILGEVAYNF